MVESFSIDCVRSKTTLLFEVKHKDFYQVTLTHPAFTVSKGVWEYSEGDKLAALLLKLGQRNTPWEGTVTWNSIDPEFQLDFRCDRLGHVTVGMMLCKNSMEERWKVEAELKTEIGQLSSLANSATHFFQTVLTFPEAAE
jgi:hypothetical protein